MRGERHHVVEEEPLAEARRQRVGVAQVGVRMALHRLRQVLVEPRDDVAEVVARPALPHARREVRLRHQEVGHERRQPVLAGVHQRRVQHRVDDGAPVRQDALDERRRVELHRMDHPVRDDRAQGYLDVLEIVLGRRRRQAARQLARVVEQDEVEGDVRPVLPRELQEPLRQARADHQHAPHVARRHLQVVGEQEPRRRQRPRPVEDHPPVAAALAEHEVQPRVERRRHRDLQPVPGHRDARRLPHQRAVGAQHPQPAVLHQPPALVVVAVHLDLARCREPEVALHQHVACRTERPRHRYELLRGQHDGRRLGHLCPRMCNGVAWQAGGSTLPDVIRQPPAGRKEPHPPRPPVCRPPARPL